MRDPRNYNPRYSSNRIPTDPRSMMVRSRPTRNRNVQASAKEDLSVDSYISKYGGIKSVIDGSVHTSKMSYNEHLRSKGKIIKDW